MPPWVGPAQVLGRLLYLGFAKWVSARSLGLLVLGGLPVSLAILALADHTTALLLFALLFGFANGLVTIVRGGLVPKYFGREHVGRISGAMSGIALLSRAAAPLLIAWLLLALPGYREMLLALAALGVASVVAFALARPPRAQRCGPVKTSDQVQCLRAAAHRTDRQLAVERCQLPVICVCQGQQVAVGHLCGVQQAARVDAIGLHQADAVGPEGVPG